MMPDARVDGEWQVPASAAVRLSNLTGSNQLKTDVDVYNEKNTEQRPIQVPLDFTLDVEELQLPLKAKKAA